MSAPPASSLQTSSPVSSPQYNPHPDANTQRTSSRFIMRPASARHAPPQVRDPTRHVLEKLICIARYASDSRVPRVLESPVRRQAGAGAPGRGRRQGRGLALGGRTGRRAGHREAGPEGEHGREPARRRPRTTRAAPARGPVRRLHQRADRRRGRRGYRCGRARGSPRLQEGVRSDTVARAGDARRRGDEGLGAEGLRSRGDPADRRGEGRGTVQGHAAPSRLVCGRDQAAVARRGRRSQRDRAGGSGAVGVTRVLGIDLGTTNSALATASDDQAPVAQAITQVVGPGEIAERPTLPSFLLLPSEQEVPASHLQLPWSGPMRYAVGTFARDRGAELPHRLVASAKSLLCIPAIDRTALVLPFRGAQRELDEAMQGGERVSPVNASSRYLAHLRAAWADANPAEPAAEQEVLVTVPASFDPVARELTVVAAREAGFDKVTLLEEPHPAFYAYLAARGDAWRKDLSPGDVVLVCDLGGGFLVFSLIEVRVVVGFLLVVLF